MKTSGGGEYRGEEVGRCRVDPPRANGVHRWIWLISIQRQLRGSAEQRKNKQTWFLIFKTKQKHPPFHENNADLESIKKSLANISTHNQISTQVSLELHKRGFFRHLHALYSAYSCPILRPLQLHWIQWNGGDVCVARAQCHSSTGFKERKQSTAAEIRKFIIVAGACPDRKKVTKTWDVFRTDF